MRFGFTFSILIGLLVPLTIETPAQEKKELTLLEQAREHCTAWTEDTTIVGDKSPKEILEQLKIDKKTIHSDFIDIQKALGDKSPESAILAKFTENAANLPRTKEEFRDLYIAIWHAWRIRKAKNLQSVLDDLGDFAKIRFVSDPKAAKVLIDVLPHGETPRHVYLNCKGKFELQMTKDGYESWTKSGYTPPARGETIDEKLKKKP